MNKEDILQYFNIMNDKLRAVNATVLVNIYGGAVMCLVYNSRDNTKDIDALFEPEEVLDDIIKEIALEHKLDSNWFNNDIKLFKPETTNNKLFKDYSNLKIYVPDAEYMLALKCFAARFGKSKDIEDVLYLLRYLDIKIYSQAIDIIEKYYDLNQIKGEMREFLLEELGE